MEHEIAVQPFFTRWQNRLAEVGFAMALVVYVLFSVVWSFAHRDVFFSAEERATYLFARNFQENSSLAIPAPGRALLPDAVHPTGMMRSGDHLVPLGIPAYPLALGIVAKTTGSWFMPLLTPLLAIVGILSFVALLKPFVGRRVAMASGALTLLHPAFLMYTLRGYYPDAAFLSLAMIAVSLFVRILMLPKKQLPADGNVELQIPWYLELGKKRHLLSTLFGVAMGLAMVIRPSETVWVALVLAVLFIVLRARLRPFSFLFAASGALLILIPALYLHWLYYGEGTQEAATSLVRSLFLAPIGSDPSFLRAVFSYFFVRMAWWITIPVVLGLIQLLRRGTINKLQIRLAVMAALGVLVALWVIWHYGGMLGMAGIGGTPSVGSPFTRHFLPVYIMTLPIAAAYLCSFRRRSPLNRIWIMVAAIVFVGLSVRAVFWQPQGLLPLTETYRSDVGMRQAVVSATPADAVILMNAPDNVVFPEREVFIVDGDADEIATLTQLRASRIPLWFLNNDATTDGIPDVLRATWRKAGYVPRARPTFSGVTLYQLMPLQ